MNTKDVRDRKLELKLTDRQRAIIVGLLLGDGHLETQNGGRTYRLKVEHGAAQADYVQWLFNELREWIPADTPYVKVRKDGVQNSGFTTYSLMHCVSMASSSTTANGNVCRRSSKR